MRKVEAPGRHGLATYALRGLGWLHSLARGKHLIYQHFSMHVKLLAEAQQQVLRAICVRVTRQVLHMEARSRASIFTQSLALQCILADCMVQRKALVPKDARHRTMYGAAARLFFIYIFYIFFTRTGNTPVGNRTVTIIGIW